VAQAYIQNNQLTFPELEEGQEKDTGELEEEEKKTTDDVF
jgi:hypothetical protein